MSERITGTTQALKKARQTLHEGMLFEGVINLMKWDMKAYMPPSGREWRAESSTYMSGKRVEIFTAPASHALADYLSALDLTQLDSDIDRALVRRFLAYYNEYTAIPAELQHELSVAHFIADSAWHEARRVNDYEVFKPHLKKFFELKYRATQVMDPNRHPLEVLINVNDEDLTVADCGRLLGELKEGTSEIMFNVLPLSNEVDDSFLQIFEKHTSDIDALIQYQCNRFGYAEEQASYAKIVHAWSATIGPRDSRVTMHHGDPGIDNFFTAVHEMGHTLYTLGSSDEVIESGIWGGMRGSAQESQSRFYENIISRSPQFWKYFFPFVQERVPEMRKYSWRDFYMAIMKVKPSLKRTTAEELTYNIHPVIRFEIERDMFELKLDFDKLPEIWADKYEESLGIRPANDVEGCLQDIHWTEDFGIFQAYSMGNIFDGMLLNKVLQDIPDFYTQIEEGKFADILQWMRTHIHQHGFTYPCMELMRRATGEEITSKYYLDYLKDKYYTLYGYDDSKN